MKSLASAGGGDGSSGCSTTSRSSGSPGTTAQWSNTYICEGEGVEKRRLQIDYEVVKQRCYGVYKQQ